jgi:uncharacterized protein
VKVTSLHVYPLKSAAAVDLQHAELDAYGLAGDRRYLLVDATSGKQITAREYGKLVLLRAVYRDGSLELNGLPNTVHVRATAERMAVQVWDDVIDACVCDSAEFPAADLGALIARFLGIEHAIRVVYFDADSRRQLNQKYAPFGRETAFADGFPVLITSHASLRQLDAWRGEGIALPMQRFRSNVVIDGDMPPFAEDSWRRVRIGEVEFDLVKPCVRCVLTTVNHQTGERDPSKQPLELLKVHRRSEKGVLFGMNMLARSTSGTLRMGDVIEVLE